MTEIPDDVMQAAREAHAEFAKSSVRDNLTVIIARAIMAERERCAIVTAAYLSMGWNGSEVVEAIYANN